MISNHQVGIMFLGSMSRFLPAKPLLLTTNPDGRALSYVHGIVASGGDLPQAAAI